MTFLRKCVDDYLAMRRALGYKLESEGRYLPDFAAFIGRSGSRHITVALAVAWATRTDASPATAADRLRRARLFAEFVRTLDPRTEVPPRDLLPHRTRRATPYLYSDADVSALIEAAYGLRASFLRRSTVATLIGLLAATGMRKGEARKLDRSDFNRREGVITIRGAKFGKSRQLPLDPTVRDALVAYQRIRDHAIPQPTNPSFFVTRTGRRLAAADLDFVFYRLLRRTGLSERRPRPRIHDLRHSFAIRTLLDWYRADVDVDARLPLLSTYLGHVIPSSTYWYLTAVPDLVTLAARRLERAFGGRR